MAIRNVGLNHPGGVYLYRIHDLKLNSLCNGYTGLKNYLDNVFNNCPNNYFLKLRLRINIRLSLVFVMIINQTIQDNFNLL